MKHRELHDGRSDGLQPLESLRLDQVDSFADLLRGMSRTAFAGRQLGEAFEILLDMVRDPDCLVVMTLSGAMTVAKQGSLVCEMIDRGMVQAIVSTGALMAHGLTESIGLAHYRYDPTKSDKTLFDQGYNRIYDTLEMESNLNEVEVVVRTVLEENEPPGEGWCSSTLCQSIGKKLDELDQGPGVLRSAFQKECPVFIPAFTDSEIGLDVATWAMKQSLNLNEIDRKSSDAAFQAVPPFNPFLDLQAYARLIGRAKRLGIFTIGGGVPRNWAQQVAPYYDITNHRVGMDLAAPRGFNSACGSARSRCTGEGFPAARIPKESSWGKFVSPQEGRFAEVACDATAVWPLLLKGVCEELDRDQ